MIGTRWGLAGVTAVVVCSVIPPFLVGALAPQIRSDLPFHTGHLGLALSACYTVTAVLSPVAGWFVGRVGARRSLRLACGLTTLGLVGISSATRAEHVILALALVGIPNALTQPASNDVLSRVKAPRRRALSFGLVQASIPAASLIAGVVLAAASYGISWRGSVLVVAAVTVLAQLALPRSAAARGRPGSPRPSRPVAPDPTPPGSRVLLFGLVATGCLASAAATALPSFAATTGLAAGLAPWVVAAAQIAGSVTSVVIRVLAPLATSHASMRRRLHAIAGLMLLGTVAMAGIATGTTAGFVLGSIAAFGLGWGWNGLYNLVVATVRPGRIAATTGITQAGIFLGGTLGPLAFAVAARSADHDAAWLLMAAVMGAAALAAASAARAAPLRAAADDAQRAVLSLSTHSTPTPRSDPT